MAALTQYKCPCCGGLIEFDSSTQKMKCPYCDSEFEVAAVEAANNANAGISDGELKWDETGTAWQDGELDGMTVYSCNSCGGEIVADKTTGATQCPYCGNPVTVKSKFSGDLRPDLIIPFKLDKKAAKEAYKRFISNKKLLPKQFKEENHIDEIKGVYVPHWLFNCCSQGEISYRGVTTRMWSDKNYNYTKRSYYNIIRGGSVSFEGIPADGSSKMPDDLMESIEPFNLDEAVDFKAAYLAGYLADRYDVSYEESTARANERVRQSTAEAFRSTVSGYNSVTTQNTGISISNGLVKYALYPVWLLHTTYNDEKYTFAMNGQTGKMVGNLPLDKKAFNKWFGILGAGLSALFFAVAVILFN